MKKEKQEDEVNKFISVSISEFFSISATKKSKQKMNKYHSQMKKWIRIFNKCLAQIKILRMLQILRLDEKIDDKLEEVPKNWKIIRKPKKESEQRKNEMASGQKNVLHHQFQEFHSLMKKIILSIMKTNFIV